MALQFRQIVELGRGHALRLGFDGFDARFAGARPLDNARRLLAIGGQPHGHGERLLLRHAEPRATIRGLLGGVRRMERSGHFQVVFGHEAANGEFTLDQHGQRGCLDAPDR